jgi:hypothetical protein
MINKRHIFRYVVILMHLRTIMKMLHVFKDLNDRILLFYFTAPTGYSLVFVVNSTL